MTTTPQFPNLPRLIALTGYAGAGKDTLAAPLIADGYERLNFGDFIKSFFTLFLAGSQSVAELRELMCRNLAEGETEEDLDTFFQKTIEPLVQVLIARARAGLPEISPFTENREEKALIRPLLERGGELIYDWIFASYFTALEHLLLGGKRVVNTRICKVREAQKWRELGGRIWEVKRLNWSPSTDWERQVVEELCAHQLIDRTVHNDVLEGDDIDTEIANYLQFINQQMR